MFENLGLEVPPQKNHRDLNQASAVAMELPRVRRPLNPGTPPSKLCADDVLYGP
jgi:hypothetical protein